MTETLFLTRAFPPSVGGMQAYAAHLHERFAEHHRTHLVAHRGERAGLPAFILRALAEGVRVLTSRPVDHLYVGDGVMAPVGRVLALLAPRARTTLTVHGLDLTHPDPVYQAVLRASLTGFDAIVANSQATAEQALARGVSPERLRVIPCGVLPPSRAIDPVEARRRLADRVPSEGRLLLTVGRLVRRKGVRWFLEEVFPRLPEDVVYAVAGDGPELDAVRRAAGPRAAVLGRVSDDLRDDLLAAADVMVMPNVPVAGDMEGFGIVALEAGVRGVPVLASRLEGIVDAVEDGATGILVPAGDAEAFVRAVSRASALPREEIPARVLARCHWDRVFDAYVQALGLTPDAPR